MTYGSRLCTRRGIRFAQNTYMILQPQSKGYGMKKKTQP
jgi:hypothetical protein